MSLTTLMERVFPQVGVRYLNSVAGNTDQTARDLLVHCNEAGDEIRGRAEWRKLYRELTVLTGASSVAIPDDMHRLVQGGPITRNTVGDYTPFNPVRSADAWRFIESVGSVQPHYFVTDSLIKFSPVVTAAGALVRYISKNWVGGTKEEFQNDADVADVPESLLVLGTVWRFKRAKGRPFEDTREEFEAELAREIRYDRGIVT